MAPKRPKRPPRSFNGAAREARRWDDPDDDDSEEEGEKIHPQTDTGLGAGSDDEVSGEDLRGSDSDNGAEDLPAGLASRPKAKAKAKGKAEDDDEGLWDPLLGLRPRKRPRAQAGAPGAPAATAQAGLAEGAAVCLVGLLKAPDLNGKTGTVAGPVDGATGRLPVLLANGVVKSLKKENVREVLTGALVRLKGLQGAVELNGQLAECGDLDLASERYSIFLADGKQSLKKVKGANLDFVARYLSLGRVLAAPAQQPLLNFGDALQQLRERRVWKAQLELLQQLRLPEPRLFKASAIGKPLAASALPTAGDGCLACRLLAVSSARNDCCPSSTEPEERRRLAKAGTQLLAGAPAGAPEIVFLMPGDCSEPLAGMRSAACCAWPLWLQICQALVCLESEHRPAKAWCRTEQLLAGQVLSKPVYLLGPGGVSAKAGDWLLSDQKETVEVGAPLDGQVLPGEKALVTKVCELLPGGARGKASLKCYRL